MEDRDSAQAIIQQFNGYQLPGANLPLQVRFADSLAQKKLKGTARKRMWRTREFASIGGVSLSNDLRSVTRVIALVLTGRCNR